MEITVQMLWHGDNPAKPEEPARWHQETIHRQELRDGVIVGSFRLLATFPDGFTSLLGQVDLHSLGGSVERPPPFDVRDLVPPSRGSGRLPGSGTLPPGESDFDPLPDIPEPNFYPADGPRYRDQ